MAANRHGPWQRSWWWWWRWLGLRARLTTDRTLSYAPREQIKTHKVRDEGGRLLEEAAKRRGLEGLGNKGETSGVQGAEGGEVGERAAEDHVRLVLDLAAGAEAAHALCALEAHASGAVGIVDPVGGDGEAPTLS